jgi:hypothetical protein
LQAWIFEKSSVASPVFEKQYLHTRKDVMDTMTYASFAAFRENVADMNKQPLLPETEFTPLDQSQIVI